MLQIVGHAYQPHLRHAQEISVVVGNGRMHRNSVVVGNGRQHTHTTRVSFRGVGGTRPPLRVATNHVHNICGCKKI